jgi:hypothetical protein
MTREKYRGRLAKFFDFVGVEGTSMPERARTFVEMSKNDRAWLFDSILPVCTDAEGKGRA